MAFCVNLIMSIEEDMVDCFEFLPPLVTSDHKVFILIVIVVILKTLVQSSITM